MKRVLIILLALLSLSFVPIASRPVQAAGPTVYVIILDTRFVPDQINATTGTTVIWNNTGANPHNVTSIGDVTFQSSPYTLQPYGTSGQHTYSLVFNVPSIYHYEDGLNPSMTAVLNVTGAPINSGGGSGGNNGGGSGGSGGGGSGGSGGGGSTPTNSVTTGYFVPVAIAVVLVLMPLGFIVYRRLASQKPPQIT